MRSHISVREVYVLFVLRFWSNWILPIVAKEDAVCLVGLCMVNPPVQ